MKILVSQKTPSNLAPYEPVIKKNKAQIDFFPFFLIEPLSAREFRAQRINLPDYSAVVFSSRHAIDAYFKLAEEMRFKVPDTMKYFCTTELVAMYLQKHTIYRKRKVFFGDGTIDSVVAQISAKHKDEKFLISTSEGANVSAFTSAFSSAGLDYTVGVFVKSVPQDLSSVAVGSYDMIVLYNPFDVKSLFASYPDFKQGDIKMVAFGRSIVTAMEEAGLRVDVKGPTPEAPSAAKAIELFLSKK